LSLFQLNHRISHNLTTALRRQISSKRLTFLRPEYISRLNEISTGRRDIFWNAKDMQIWDLTKNCLPQLLRYEDRNSMAHSIEARTPFVDFSCIEAALSMRSCEKIKEGFSKHPIRMVADKILPKTIAWRTNKIGFAAPDEIWFQKHEPIMTECVNNSHIIHAICEKPPIFKTCNRYLKWRLYNLAVWEKQWSVEI